MLLIVCLMMLLIFLGMPVAFCIIGCSVLYASISKMDLIFLPQQMVDGVNIFPLVAVPFSFSWDPFWCASRPSTVFWNFPTP